MATDLYLIRHGQAYSNVEGSLGGERGDKGLTELGFTQARALAARLEAEAFQADLLYASTLPRAWQTAEHVARAIALPIIGDDDLHELRPGDADGLLVSAARERFPQMDRFLVETYTPIAPNGESWGSFQLRVAAALERIVLAHPDKRIVIVAHGGVIEVSFLHLLGLGPEQRVRAAFHMRNTAITHWRHTTTFAGRVEWQLHTHNDAAHLAAIEG